MMTKKRPHPLLENFRPYASGLSAVDAIGTQLSELMNSGLTRWRLTVNVDAVAESGRNPVSEHQIDDPARLCRMCGLTRDGTVEETKCLGANGDGEKNIFGDELTTSRIGHHTRLIHIMLKVLAIYIY